MPGAAQHVLGIDPKMYRHFAAATLLISLAVAMLTDNGQSDSVLAPIREARDDTARKDAADRARQAPALVDNRSSSAPSDGGRDGGSYGAPMDSGGTSIVIANSAGAAQSMAPSTINIDPKVLEAMPPEQRDTYVKKLQERKRALDRQGPRVPTSAEVSALGNASAMRSGADRAD